MFIINDMVYADAGKLLVGSNKIGYQFKNTESFKEEDVIIDDIKFVGSSYVCYNNGKLWDFIGDAKTYPQLKAKFVKKRYSNDDQIAILLNKDDTDDGLMKYEKMQEWRAWSAKLAKTIINIINND